MVLAFGGSTNAVIHLIAMAGRAGVPLYLDRFDALSRGVPVLANIRPSGKYLMQDFFEAGGLRGLMSRLDLHDVPTVSGVTRVGDLAGAEVYDDDVIRPLSNPLLRRGRAWRSCAARWRPTAASSSTPRRRLRCCRTPAPRSCSRTTTT